MSSNCRRLVHFRRILSAVVLAGLSLLPTPGPAQQAGTATLRGTVVDEESGDTIPEAIVRVKGRDPVTVGPSGRFELANLEAGTLDISIQAIGFSPKTFKLGLVAGQVLTRVFPLEFTGARLPEVAITARATRLAPRYTDFERRRERGLGAYFRWEEIKARGFSSVGDALRTVRGVRMKCNQQNYECFAEMARSPGCYPRWWVDGVEVYSFHENTPIRDIYGIEVYRGAAEMPADFGGSNAACGVIVLWTKSKPYR